MVERQVAKHNAEEENTEETKRTRLTEKRAKKRAMVRLAAIRLVLCLLVGLFFYIVKASRSSHYAVNPSARLFHPMSPVREFRSGDVQTMRKLVAHSELSMVMFYAPWCAESRLAAQEYVEAGKELHKEIFFAAINCWEYAGECRKKFAFQKFPKFFVYNSRLEGIEYNGPVTTKHMVKFLRRVASPVTYVRNLEDLVFFCTLQDTGVLAYFDFSGWRPTLGYLHYYLAAQNALEIEPFHGVNFGVITSLEVAGLVKIKEPRTVVMVRALNDTLVYPDTRNFSHQEILAWVEENKVKTVQWLPLSGMKSLQLSTELYAGPSLLYFTPDNPDGESTSVAMFREVAMDYFNCNDSQLVRDLVNISREYRKILRGSEEPTETRSNCDNSNTNNRKTLSSKSLSSVKSAHSLNAVGDSLQTQGKDNIDSMAYSKPTCKQELQGDCPNQCKNTQTYDSVARNVKTSQTECNTVPTEKSCLYSKESNLRHSTNGDTVQSASDEAVDIEGKDVNITGLGCRTNKSLGFYLLDSNSQWSFAENMGVKETDGETESIVIVDVRNEVQFVMDPSLTINETNIAAFIHNFTRSQLSRHLNTAPPPVRVCLPNATQPCVVEVTGDTFHDVVLDETKDVLLLYYAPWCGACSALSHIWLVLASYFKRASNLVLARINGDKNDLPWEFTVPAYPTVIFFPALRKDMSVKYPDNLPMTLPNLAEFVLAHARRRNRPRSNITGHKVTPDCQEKTEASNLRIQSLERELSSMKEEIETLRTQAQKLQDAFHIVKGANIRLNAENREKDLRIEALRKSEAKLKEALKEKEVRLLQADVFMRALQEGSVKATSENVLLKMQVSALQQALDSIYNVMEADKKQNPSEKKDPRHSVDAASPPTPVNRKDRQGEGSSQVQKDSLKDAPQFRKVAQPVREGGRQREHFHVHSARGKRREDTEGGKQRVSVVPTAKIQHTQVLHTHENNQEDYT
ncbi:thioredoxin domain-containing protein 11-like [Branchiostoma floridae]|uniref:Thioredoxin domain-containing protein 11-like n=1 Tax=Branchiostoma floridae TaxID=7739 RepID=A0A9J7M8J5_BRAFL|nr:thioredoxin domain-containing protein 11-like [Branchiostoma floridae]